MKQGKHICETLKGIRKEIAQANDIDYTPIECSHNGDCAGTCPACESEMRWLERQLRLRQSLGKAVIVAGLSLALSGVATASPSPSPVPSDRKKNVKQHRTHKQKKKKNNNVVLPIVGNLVEGQVPSLYETAEFPNGQQALLDSIVKNIEIPKELIGSSDEKVVVMFSILTDCSIGEVKIEKSTNPAIDKYIIDAIRKLPKFSKPGHYANGDPVTTWLIIPITVKGKDSE